MESKLTISGRVKITEIYPDREVVFFESKNKIMLRLLDTLRYHIAGDEYGLTGHDFIANIGLNDQNIPEDYQVASMAGAATAPVTFSEEGARSVKFTATFGNSANGRTYTEVGLLFDYASPNVAARKVIPSLVKHEGISVRVEWTLTFRE